MKFKGFHPPNVSLIGLLVGFVVPLLLVHTAIADIRPFAYTYNAKTIPQGQLELEHYLDIGLQGWDDPNTMELEDNWGEADWKHQVELEYGITDAWDFGFYNVFAQKPYGSLEYDGLKLRTRYNLAEGRDWLIQPGLYFEVGYFGDAVKFEEMVILTLEMGRFVTSLNLKGEEKIEYGGGDTKTEIETIISYGAGFHLGARTALSLEYYGKAKFKEGEMDYFVNYLGPTLHVVGGPFYWNIALQPQLGTLEDKAGVRVRSLIGILF